MNESYLSACYKLTFHSYNDRKLLNAADRRLFVRATKSPFRSSSLLNDSCTSCLFSGLEFAYCQAPKRMQAVVTGLFFIANGVGSMLGSLLFEVVSLLSNNNIINTKTDHTKIADFQGNLQYFFFGLAALNLLNILLFARYSWKRRIKKESERQQTVHEYIRSALRNTPRKT